MVVCMIGISVPAGLGWDFANFYDAGRRVAAGQVVDLYQPDRAIDGAAPQGHMRFWSAPLSAVLLAPLSLLQPAAALAAFKLENAVALFVALWLLYAHCRRFFPPSDAWHFAATFASACVLFQPFWTVFRVGGQTTPTVFLLLVLALFCYTTARLMSAAVLLTTVVMVKPTFALMLVFLAAVAGAPFTGALIVALAGAGVISIVFMGWPIHEQFLRGLLEASAMSRSWLYNSSVYVPLENFRLLEAAGSWNARLLGSAEWGIRLLIVALFLVVMRRSHRDSWLADARRHFEFLMAICFWLVISQIIWEHYLAALFIPLAYFLAARSAFSSQARGLVAAILVLALGQNLILVQALSAAFHFESTAGLIVTGLLKAGPLLLLLALLGLYHREIFASYRLPAWNDGMVVRQLWGADAATDVV
jgi:hypothetical protein